MRKNILSVLGLMAILTVTGVAKDNKADTLEAKVKSIVISATRYPETVIEAPMAISIIHKSEFSASKGYGLGDALNLVPGVFAQTRTGGTDTRITIRGFGARGAGDRSNAGTSRGIKFVIDGIAETEPDGRTAFDNFEMSAINSIEVLRSNASAVWGNAAGGVVSVSTVPDFENKFIDYGVTGGSYGFIKNAVSAGTKSGDAKIFTTITNTKYDGYRDWSSGEKLFGNFGVVAPMGAKSTLGTFLTLTDNQFYIPGPLTQAEYDANPEQANSTYLSRKERRHNRTARLGMNLETSIDDANFINATAFVNPKYLQRSERGTYRDFTRYRLGASFNFRNESKFIDNTKNTLIAGLDADAQDGAIIFYSLKADGSRGETISQNKKEGAAAYGAFLQDEFVWNEKISVILGARYDAIDYNTQDFTRYNAKESKTYDHVTPKFGFTYRLDNQSSAYFNIGGGVEVPAGNETDPVAFGGQDTLYMINPLLDPITSTTLEFGYKTIKEYDGFLKSIYFDAAAFYISVKNDIIPYSGGKFYLTAGKTNRLGAELALKASMDYGLSVNASFTYMNAKYDDYKVDSTYYKKPGIVADYSDNKAAGIPDFYYNLAVKFAPKYLQGLFVELCAQGVSDYFVDDANTYKTPAYTLLNATVGTDYTKIAGGLSGRLFFTANNIADTKYAASAFINPDKNKAGAPVFLESGLPRNFVVGVNLKLD